MKNLNNSILRIFTLSILFCFGSIMVDAQNNKSAEKDNQHNPENESKTSTKHTEGTTQSEPKMGTLKNHSIEIQKIIKNENGVIRGYDFGTTKQKIKDTEDAKYVADGKDFVIYEVNINATEKAEIIYYLDENEKVKGFGVAFLVNPSAMAENVEATLIDDFQKYFNERYGKFTVNAKNDEVWTSKEGYTVEMGDSSESDTMIEIEIEIFKK